jgi:hypothetical protein
VDLAVFRGDLFALWHDSDPGWGRGGVLLLDGQQWRPIASGFREAGVCPVSAGRLAVYDDQLYATGFSFAQPMARWDGETWWPVPSPHPCDACDLEVFDGKLFATVPVGFALLMSWNGRSWEQVTNADSPWLGSALSLRADGDKLVLGGWFAKRPAVLDGVADLNSRPGAGGVLTWDGRRYEARLLGSGAVCATADFDGRLVAGGEFDWDDGVALHHVASWNQGRWEPVGRGWGLDISEPDHDSHVNALVGFRALLEIL